MRVPPAAAVAVALAGNFLLSLGMVLQKRHVGWIGHRGSKGAEYRRDQLGWLAGFLLMNLQPVFNYAALMGLPPGVVGAASGSNVAFTALIASFVLGERLGRRPAAWIALMFAAMCVAAYRGGEGSGPLARVPLVAALALPLAAAALAAVARRRRRGPNLAVVLAAAAGGLGGFMILPMRALQTEVGGDLARWLSEPYLYLYALAGAGGFAAMQLAYKDGRLASVSPAYFGMQALWPALASYLVFASPFDPVQAASLAVVTVCIVAVAGSGGGS